jgi:hypothetical protein
MCESRPSGTLQVCRTPCAIRQRRQYPLSVQRAKTMCGTARSISLRFFVIPQKVRWPRSRGRLVTAMLFWQVPPALRCVCVAAQCNPRLHPLSLPGLAAHLRGESSRPKGSGKRSFGNLDLFSRKSARWPRAGVGNLDHVPAWIAAPINAGHAVTLRSRQLRSKTGVCRRAMQSMLFTGGPRSQWPGRFLVSVCRACSPSPLAETAWRRQLLPPAPANPLRCNRAHGR